MKRRKGFLVSSLVVAAIACMAAVGPVHALPSGGAGQTNECQCNCVVEGKVTTQKISAPGLCAALDRGGCTGPNSQGTFANGTLSSCRPYSDPSTHPPPVNSNWDLLSSVTDDNKLLKNPDFRWHATGGTPMNLEYCLRNGSFSSDCTTQNVTIDTPGLPDSLICNFPDSVVGINGHVDWFDATYEGSLTWDENSIDHDFNFYLDSLSGMGRFHPEFNSDETIDNFQTPWWKSFHDNHPPKGTTLGYTIMTGLFGFDCEHDCRVEVHPVHAVAIRVNDNRADETWAIFVRNWGNEGFCSSQQHFLDLDGGSFTFRLPWNTDPFGHVSVGTATTFLTNVSGVTGPIVVPEPPSRLPRGPTGGVLVTFLLPPPDARAIVHGELHLQWAGATSAQGVPPLPPPRPIAAWNRTGTTVALSPQPGPPDFEDKLGALVAQMSPAQRQIYQSKTSRTVAPHTIALRPGTPANVPTIGQPPRLRHVADAKKAAADQIQRDALCAAYANNVPGFPKYCPAPSPPPSPGPVRPGVIPMQQR